MTNIVSYSLWGDNPKYTIGAIRNAEGVNKLYPGWECRIYYADVPDEIITELNSYINVNLIDMSTNAVLCNPDWTGMFWRFLAADSDDVVLSRDTDSRITQREVDAVNDWLESGSSFHIMRDHPYHATAILGGMWGARYGILKGVSKKIEAFEKEDRWQIDQDFLKTIIYPEVRGYSKVHDPFFERNPFPTDRIEDEFVGKAFNGDDTECAPGLGNMTRGR